jgi:hypothetical protein
MNAVPETDRSGLITCYEGEFAASDAHSAMAYATVLMAAFDFEIPSAAASEPFAASTELFLLPELTVTWAKITASRFTRTIRTIAARGTDQILVVCYR